MLRECEDSNPISMVLPVSHLVVVSPGSQDEGLRIYEPPIVVVQGEQCVPKALKGLLRPMAESCWPSASGLVHPS